MVIYQWTFSMEKNWKGTADKQSTSCPTGCKIKKANLSQQWHKQVICPYTNSLLINQCKEYRSPQTGDKKEEYDLDCNNQPIDSVQQLLESWKKTNQQVHKFWHVEKSLPLKSTIKETNLE